MDFNQRPHGMGVSAMLQSRLRRRSPFWSADVDAMPLTPYAKTFTNQHKMSLVVKPSPHLSDARYHADRSRTMRGVVLLQILCDFMGSVEKNVTATDLH